MTKSVSRAGILKATVTQCYLISKFSHNDRLTTGYLSVLLKRIHVDITMKAVVDQ